MEERFSMEIEKMTEAAIDCFSFWEARVCNNLQA